MSNLSEFLTFDRFVRLADYSAESWLAEYDEPSLQTSLLPNSIERVYS